MQAVPVFRKLNEEWNAEPNAPFPSVEIVGNNIVVRFLLNPYKFKQFKNNDRGALQFIDCSRYRLGATNDEGWYMGKCRYSKIAPKWGEFYEISEDGPQLEEPKDWKIVNPDSRSGRHFLFYFRDNTFECIAADWGFEDSPENALNRKIQGGSKEFPSPESNEHEEPEPITKPAFSVSELLSPLRRANWKIMVPVWAVIAGILFLGYHFHWEPRIVGGGVLLLALYSNALVWLASMVGLLPIVGPLLVKILALPVIWFLNATGSMISYVAVRRGYSRDVLTYRGLTMALIAGIVIGFILGKLI